MHLPNQRLRKPDSYPRMHITRQAIPGFVVKNTLDKRGCTTPVHTHRDETGEHWGEIRETSEREQGTPLEATSSGILQDTTCIAEG